MPPLGALIVGLFAVAVPVILLMTVWAGVTALRLLFPEDPLLFDPVSRRRRATARGEFVPVRLRDILDDQEAQTPRSVATRDEVVSETNPLFDDLWLRRN